MKLTNFFLFWLFVGSFLFAQTDTKKISFRDITTEDGLSQNSVVSIAQDSIGYLWFATQDGLNKYDGSSFKFFPKQYQDITRSNYAQLGQLYTDSYGDLWSYSSDEIIEKYNYTTQQFNSITSLSSVTVLYRIDDNTLFVGTLNNGLKKVDLETKSIESVFQDNLLNASVFEIQNISNQIYLGTSKGVFIIDNESLHQVPKTDSLAVSSIVKRQNELVIGTYGNGVKFLNLESYKESDEFSTRVPERLNIQDVFLDSKSRLWIATYGDGLFLIDDEGRISNHTANKEDPFALHYNDILKIHEDMTGNIWFGSDGAGLSYYDEHLIKFNTLTSRQVPDNVHVDVIRAIAVDALGVMWLGTSGKGLTRINLAKKSFNTFTLENSRLSSNRIMSLLLVDNDLWIGHQSSGLQILNKSGEYRSFPELENLAIWKIYKDRSNNIWLCTRTSGLIKFSSNEGVLAQFDSQNSDLETNNIRTIEQDYNNDLWIGTDQHGLYKLNTKTNNIEKVPQIKDKIKALHFADSSIWIGTNGNGVKSIHVDDLVVKDYFFNEVLANKVIYGLLSDGNGNLWLSTNKGISRFSPNHPYRKFAENYSVENGTQAFEFNTGAYFKALNGDLYFGGIEGINWFDPNKITYNEIMPKTIISKFEIFGEEHIIRNGEKFKHSQNTMTFTFAGLHYSYPEKNFYRYKLTNQGTGWTVPNYNNVAHFTNLPPDDYTLMVESSNYEGVWNKEAAKFSFTILKPWYATNTALAGYLLLLLLSIYAVYKYFKFRWEIKMQLQLEHAETERLKKLDEFKTKLYTNISHEFRTPLTLISGPVDKQLERDDLLEQNKKDLNIVKQNANRLLNLVNQMIDLSLIDSGQLSLKVSKGNLSVLINQIVEAFQYKAQEKNITIKSNIGNIEEAYYDKDIVEKVISNLLTNAIKYSPVGSTINFSTAKLENSFVVSIVNQYDKVARKDLSKLFKRFYQEDEATDGIGVGLALVKELIVLSKGSIIANNIANNQIQFTVTIPINKEAFLSSEIVDIETNEDQGLADKQVDNNGENVVLIVEDQKDIREFVVSIFNTDYKVLVAKNGVDGIEKARKHLPDLVISDVMMPITDGIELCNTIKHDVLTSHIPVILLTAKVGEENEIIGLKSGADAYITKPFNSKRLLVEVDRLITSRQHLKELYSQEFIVNPDLAITSTESKFLKRIQSVLDEHITNPDFKSERMGALLQMSRTQLHRKLKSVYGLSTSEFIRSQRLKLSLKLLKESDATVSEIAYQVGFNSPSYFIKCFKETYNSTPADYYK